MCNVDIEPVDDAVTIYIAGDSTVTDQAEVPWAGWGQLLPRFFKPDRVVVSNHAESGETLSSFLGERRMEKLLTTLRAGDYLLIQFGHNDMKQTGPDAGAFKNYTRLLKEFIATARQHGATPVLVTPMNRLSFDATGKIPSRSATIPRRCAAWPRRTGDAHRSQRHEPRALSSRWGPKRHVACSSTRRTRTKRARMNSPASSRIEFKRSELGIARDVVDELPPTKLQ